MYRTASGSRDRPRTQRRRAPCDMTCNPPTQRARVRVAPGPHSRASRAAEPRRFPGRGLQPTTTRDNQHNRQRSAQKVLFSWRRISLQDAAALERRRVRERGVGLHTFGNGLRRQPRGGGVQVFRMHPTDELPHAIRVSPRPERLCATRRVGPSGSPADTPSSPGTAGATPNKWLP